MENTDKKPEDRFKKWNLISLAFQLGFIIALPILAFGFLGKWLDAKYETEPVFALAGIALAITSTTVWLYRKFKNYF